MWLQEDICASLPAIAQPTRTSRAYRPELLAPPCWSRLSLARPATRRSTLARPATHRCSTQQVLRLPAPARPSCASFSCCNASTCHVRQHRCQSRPEEPRGGAICAAQSGRACLPACVRHRGFLLALLLLLFLLVVRHFAAAHRRPPHPSLSLPCCVLLCSAAVASLRPCSGATVDGHATTAGRWASIEFSMHLGACRLIPGLR